jgi:toxin-antitoxin system, antitoxin component, xre family|nr:MAG TPA: helix-turn-helix domain protein [Caudoviricetes sp.]
MYKEVIPMKFGEKLKALREKHHLTQTDVAKELGVTQRAISYYENNNVAPNDPEALNKLAKLFEITLDELLNNDGQKSKLHKLIEKLLLDTERNYLEWRTAADAGFFDPDEAWFDPIDTFNLEDFSRYDGYSFSARESYLAYYKGGGYLIAKLISPEGEVDIALFIFIYRKFSFIANKDSIKKIDDLYLLLLNSSGEVDSFIDEYLSDHPDDIPF